MRARMLAGRPGATAGGMARAAPAHPPLPAERELLTGWTGRAFLLGMATVVLHLLDGAFWHAAPGAVAADRIVAGLLPVAVVLLVMASWPLLPRPLQAAVALAIGFLAIAAGIWPHASDVLERGLTARDVSGLLLLAGGVALLAAGALLTQRSIQRPVRRDWRWLGRRAAVLIGAYLVVGNLLLPVFSAAYATHPRPSDVSSATLGTGYVDVTLLTDDGVRLAASYHASTNGAMILLLPGATNDRSGVAAHAELLVRHGYGVLLLDPRGTGRSEGRPNHFGWLADHDVAAALAFIRERCVVPQGAPGVGRIGLLGLSMGGEVALQAAATHPDVTAVVAEGAGARTLADARLPGGAEAWLDAPRNWLMYELTGLLSRSWAPDPLAELVPRIAPRPLLLIYGSAGQPAEITLTPRYFAAAGEPKELWKVDGAGHTRALATTPEEYEARVIAFFDAALLQPSEEGSQ